MTEPRIYRASSLGYSLERLVAPHLGYEPLPTPDWLQSKFDEGNEIEPKVLAELDALNWAMERMQEEVNLDIIPGQAIIQGHLDGVAGAFQRVVEIKSMNSRTFAEVKAKRLDAGGIMEKYKWQISAYMLATGLPAILVIYDKGSTEVECINIEEPFYLISDLANKVLEAERYIRDGIIPEGCTDYPCPYAYLHGDKEEPEPADLELDTLLTAWSEANRKRKIYEGEEKSLRDMIKEFVGEIAGKVKGSQGVRVSTDWIPEKEVNYKVAGHWETRVTAPRKGKGDGS